MSDRRVDAIGSGPLLSIAALVAATWFVAPVPPGGVTETATSDTVVVTAERAEQSDVAFAPGGNRVASSALNGRVHLWDAATGEELRTLDAHRRESYAVAFSPDGGRLATGGYDGTVRIWEAATGEPIRTLDAEPWPLDVAFSPDGEELLVGEADGDVLVHPLAGGAADTLEHPYDQNVMAVAWSPSGRRVAFAYRALRIRVAGRGPGAASDTVLRGHHRPLYDLAFTPDGGTLVSGSRDASVRIWDLRDDVAVDTLTTRMPAPFVAVSPDGGRLATGGANRTVRLWRLDAPRDTGRAVIRHDRLITGVAFSPCGDRVASTGLDGRVRIARLETGGGGCP